MKISRGSKNEDDEETVILSFVDGLHDAIKIAHNISAIPVKGRHLELPGHPHRFAKIIIRAGKKLESIGDEGRICPIEHLAVTYDVVRSCGLSLQVGANFSDVSEITMDVARSAIKGPKDLVKCLKRVIDNSSCMGLLGNEIAMTAAAGRRRISPLIGLFASFGPNHILNDDDFDDPDGIDPQDG